MISRIGEKAKVVVNKADGKYASAHDFRRAFGTRWAMKVKPMLLQKLMRHNSIETTMRYYVELDVDDMAEELWKTETKVINTSINNPTNEDKKTEKEPSDESSGTPLPD